MNSFSKLIPIGELIKPHGIKGELKILLFNEESRSLKDNKNIFLEKSSNNYFKYKIEKISYSFKKNRLKLFEINTINEAELFRGLIVFLPREDFPKLKENEFYLNDLLDFILVDSLNNKFEIVVDILHLPANDVLVVKFENKEHLIPMIKDVVKKIDMKNRQIIIEPIKGLFD